MCGMPVRKSVFLVAKRFLTRLGKSYPKKNANVVKGLFGVHSSSNVYVHHTHLSLAPHVSVTKTTLKSTASVLLIAKKSKKPRLTPLLASNANANPVTTSHSLVLARLAANSTVPNSPTPSSSTPVLTVVYASRT
jgi:hypothetical protein